MPEARAGRYDGEVRRVRQDVPPLPDGSLPSDLPGGVVPGTGELPAVTGSTGVGAPDLGVPAADRNIGGGTPTLETEAVEAEEAAEDSADEPRRYLMEILGEDSETQLYGWIQNSYTGNTNGFGNGFNFGVNPNFKANSWMGNQYYLILENTVEQSDEINFGYRVDNLFGNDWQFNYMQGLFNNAFNPGQFAGYDLAQAYIEAHLPAITEGGLDVKAGRWYTLAGYEQVPAIARPLLSVPYMFNYGQPFTHLGVLTTLHVNEKLNLYNGAINGWDRWFNERYVWGYIGGFSYTGNEDKTTIAFTAVWGPNQFPSFLPANQQIFPTGYVNIPSVAGGDNNGYHANDRTLFTTVLTHKWTDKFTQVIETDQGMEQNIPGLVNGGQTGASKSAQWQSFGNWFLWSFHPKITGVWRSEVFWDQQGVRTGTFKGDRYYEMTLGAIYKPIPNLWIRPEARYDWAQYGNPYSNGTRDSQLTLAFDVIFLY
jgi:Putative beta-barrel porin-2, OmpL-like. bbp2